MKKVLAAIGLFCIGVIIFGSMGAGCENIIHQREDLGAMHYAKIWIESGSAVMGSLLAMGIVLFLLDLCLKVLTGKK